MRENVGEEISKMINAGGCRTRYNGVGLTSRCGPENERNAPTLRRLLLNTKTLKDSYSLPGMDVHINSLGMHVSCQR